MEAGIVLLFMILLVFAIFWIGLYCFALYSLGRRLAKSYRVRLGPKIAAAIFGILSALAALPLGWLDIDFLYKCCLIFCFWLLNAQPLSVGYWAGVDIGRGEDLQRWNESADEWLSEWEEAPPACMKQWED